MKQEIISKNKEIYIKPYQYAKLAGVTRQTIYRWIKSGKIPSQNVIRECVEQIKILSPH